MSFFLFVFLCLPFVAFGQTYVATFDVANNGISGTVQVENGYVAVDLDFTQFNDSLLPANCTNSVQYHLHTDWTYGSADTVDRMGSACGGTYTSGHYDPYNACGGASSSKACACISNTYACNSSNFAADPYSCEVGDWSGKYGMIPRDNNFITGGGSSFFEVDGMDTMGMSVVFHCGDGPGFDNRVFCAPFVDDPSSNLSPSYPSQSASSIMYGVEANFGTYGHVTLEADGAFSAMIDLTSTNLTGNWSYAIFNSWNSNATTEMSDAACTAAIGTDTQWDPSSQCATQWSESADCLNMMTCNITYACDQILDPFSCAPGDLSAYGEVMASSVYTVTDSVAGILPALDIIVGKSVAFYDASGMFSMCAKFVARTSDSSEETPTSTSSAHHCTAMLSMLLSYMISTLIF